MDSKEDIQGRISEPEICIDTVGPLHNGHLGTEESGHCTEVAVVERWPLLEV